MLLCSARPYAPLTGRAYSLHDSAMDENPFFAIIDGPGWHTPFGVPPFNRIRPEHFGPALDLAMRRHRAEIDAIAANPAPAHFTNTIEALERAGQALEQICAVFSNLVSSLGGDALLAIELEYAPRLAQHQAQIALDPGVFARVAKLHAERGTLDLEADQLRLLERRHLGLLRAGAGLAPDQRARMSEISERLASLHAAFGQNVLADERDWSMSLAPADLAGLPDFVCLAAAQAAHERNLPGHILTLSRSLLEPFLTFSPRRDLRQAAWQAMVLRGANPGPHDNRRLIPDILALRAERARLLGYDSFAAFRLADTMAGTEAAVAGLTSKVWEAGKRLAATEEAALLDRARADGINGALEPWDWRYYAEQRRQAEFAIDEAALKPYFVFGSIQRAAFDAAERLFGLRMIPRPDLPVYHPDVQTYEVRKGERPVGVFIADPFARRDKRSGAWMSSFRDQHRLDGEVLPIIVNNNNFAAGDPCLLSFDDAETLFHEFGHALHGLLSDVRYPSQSGTSVRRDFVELPSQIFEHWLSVPQTLQTYARHYQTGEPLPEALMTRLLGARNFNQGFGTVEYTASAILDMALHAHPDPASLDVEAFTADVLDRLGMPAAIGLRHRPAHFQHLFSGGGYAAGYYSYLWAEVLDADGFAAFTEAGDVFDPDIAARFETILSSGDTRDPMALYIDFRGRAPDPAALFNSRGLTSD
jgi:peptidyl-dipeptidase Dcp